jgi:hypothetical protein
LKDYFTLMPRWQRPLHIPILTRRY